MNYRPRVLEASLAASLEAVGAVAIEGPRACGKTETARRASRSEVRVELGSATIVDEAAANPVKLRERMAGEPLRAVRPDRLPGPDKA